MFVLMLLLFVVFFLCLGRFVCNDCVQDSDAYDIIPSRCVRHACLLCTGAVIFARPDWTDTKASHQERLTVYLKYMPRHRNHVLPTVPLDLMGPCVESVCVLIWVLYG